MNSNNQINTKNEIKDKIKAKLADYLQEKGIDIKHNFTCLNPKHADHTPSMTFYSNSQTVHCFGCGAHYDIFDLYAIDNLDAAINADNTVSYSFIEAYNGVASMYGMDVAKIKVSPETAHRQKINSLNEDIIELAKLNLDHGADYLKSRGISLELAKKFNLGYLEKWVSPTAALKEKRKLKPTPRLIVPTSRNSYLARDTRKVIPDNEKPKPKLKEGNRYLFNEQALNDTSKPLYVTEGEFDALSIMQVTDKANVLALGSANNADLLVDALKEKINARKDSKDSNKPYYLTVLLALDNDSAGQLATQKLNAMLNNFNSIETYIVNVAKGYKDENEALVKDKEKFTKLVNDRIKAPADYLTKYFEDSEQLFEHPHIKPTGFNQLNDILGGGLQSMLYVLGAVSSLGKSTFILQIADYLAQHGTPVLFFALEMTKRELTSKLLSRITSDIANKSKDQNGLNFQTLNSGQWLADKDSRAITMQAMDYLSRYFNNLHIYDTTNKRPTVEDIKSRVDAFITKHPDKDNRPLIVVDYLQILKAVDERATDKAQVTESITTLKEIASKYDVPVLVVSSLNRASYKSAINESAFKESGEIEYFADVLLGMQFSDVAKELEDGKKDIVDASVIDRAKKKTNYEIDLKILKNRGGRRGDTIKYRFVPKFNFFSELKSNDKETILDRANRINFKWNKPQATKKD